MEHPTEIAIRVRTIASLFNSFDPSPFREKDIDAEVEAFLVGWVRELPRKAPFTIVIDLPAEEAAKPQAKEIDDAFAHYFGYRSHIAEQDLRELFRVGRRFLAIGVAVLIVCLVTSQFVAVFVPSHVVARVLEESLIIVGWVANWKPVEILLYDWLPLTRRRNLYRRLAKAKVELKPY
jgi:hypothetical protein